MANLRSGLPNRIVARVACNLILLGLSYSHCTPTGYGLPGSWGWRSSRRLGQAMTSKRFSLVGAHCTRKSSFALEIGVTSLHFTCRHRLARRRSRTSRSGR